MPATGLNRYLPDWSVTSNPGSGVKATATRPAVSAPPIGSGQNVCTSVSATLVSGAGAAGQATVNLIDGISGGATILGSWVLAVPAVAGTCIILSVDTLEIIGSANTAMTLEFSALSTGNFESVTLTGHTI
jgi:hypothetical protein